MEEMAAVKSAIEMSESKMLRGLIAQPDGTLVLLTPVGEFRLHVEEAMEASKRLDDAALQILKAHHGIVSFIKLAAELGSGDHLFDMLHRHVLRKVILHKDHVATVFVCAWEDSVS